MSITGNSSVCLKELGRLLRTCHEIGVSELEIGDIKVKFRVEYSQPTSVQSDQLPLAPEVVTSSTVLADDSQPLAKPKTLLSFEEKEVLEELRRSQLMLDDPMSFEQFIIDTDLERERAFADG